MEEQDNAPPDEPSAEEPQSPPAGEQPQSEAIDEEELRRRIEEQLRKVRVQDLLLESVVSIANLTARRIAKEDERDLEQARVGIDAMRAVVDLLEPEPGNQIRNAISELQVLYAKHAQSGGGETTAEARREAGAGEGGPAQPTPEPPPQRRGPGLWTPPGTT